MSKHDSSSLRQFRVYSTSPQSRDVAREDYVDRTIQVARWSEEFGCEGILVYTDNGLVDPWHIAQLILERTKNICPLIAVQPIYMHPYSAAKKIATLAYLFDRRIALNMLAGGFKNDLSALGDETPHDDRYLRTTEYALIVSKLLEGAGPVTFAGKYYRVRNLTLTPTVPKELYPYFLISGSSKAGMQAAQEIGAIAIKYPKATPEEEGVSPESPVACGIRVGIVTRPSCDEAWRVALERFPEDRKGQVTHKLAMKVSDSVWHKQLSESDADEQGPSRNNPYWLGPFQNYKTFCPYLVGSYEQTGHELSKYYAKGYQTIILDIPPKREELEHTGRTFAEAIKMSGI
jgi:alkanesulfonate monooxygenase